MADWPLLRNNLALADDTAFSSYKATVTASGSANTKGAYTQLVAALARSCSGVLLEVRGLVNQYVLFDIAIGGAGSEQVVVPNVGLPLNISSTDTGVLFIPIAIPAGSRVSMRCQGSGASYSLQVKAQFITDTFVGLQPITRWLDWGTVLSTSRGTVITASGSANTKGSYTELVAATGFTTKWLVLFAQATGAPRGFAIDLAIGAAASEQVIIPDIYFSNEALSFVVGPFPFSIPGGSRISARCASDLASSQTTINVLGGA